MTLKEMKIKTFSLIEEYYPEKADLAEDSDVLNKINGVVNSIQLDLMKYRKLNASYELTIKKEDTKVINLKELLEDYYQLNQLKFSEDIEYDMPNDETIILPKDYEGIFTIYYYRYPTLIEIVFEGENDEEIEKNKLAEDEDYEFELDADVLEVMPYGIAADLLKMDMISNYGRYFDERYRELKNTIQPSRTNSKVMISGGIDV